MDPEELPTTEELAGEDAKVCDDDNCEICDDDSHYPGEDMDGDHDSAMTSAGWGTDEDYGYFGGDDY